MIEIYYIAGYAIVSLLIWLFFEMTGEMADARKDTRDGCADLVMLILFWGPLLVFVAFLIIPVSIGWVFNKISKVTLFGERRG